MRPTNSPPWSVIAPIIATILLAALSITVKAQNASGPESRPAKQAGTAKSKDGTAIAYDRVGQGPALVLIAGALSDRTDASRLATLLAPKFTVINYDRRGRGKSGDTKPYAVDREIEDIEALIDQAGGSGFLFGHSSGAALALEAANKLADKVKAAVLFEPPFIVSDVRPPIPDGFFKEVGSLVEADRRGDAVALFMTKGIGVPDEMIAGMRRSPMWPAMERTAHTLVYDGAIMEGLQGGKPLPAKRWTTITARTLVVDGGRSPQFLRESVEALVAVLPNSKRLTLEHEDHSIVFSSPKSLVPVLTQFFLAEGAGETRKK